MRIHVLAAIFATALGIAGCASTSPLILAAGQGDAETVRRIVAHGAPIDGFYAGGTSALMEAVIHGNVEAVRILLRQGANVRLASDGTRNTALHFAVGCRHYSKLDLFELLFEYGADPLVPNTNGETAYSDLLSSNRSPGIDAVRALFELKMSKEQHNKPRNVEAEPPLQSVVKPVGPKPIYPTFSSAEFENDYAVVVGIENYPDLPAATHAERDAAAMKGFFRALGVPERNIILLTGSRATKSGLEKTIEDWLPNNVSEKSRVYFYYSGHGAPDPKTGGAYLLPADGDPQYLARTGYPLKQLYFQLGQLKAKSVLVALDSCFSGAGGRSVLAKGTRPLVGKVDTAVQAEGKISVISASAGDQISGANDEAGYGLFTYNLLQGLNGAAKDAQGRVTLKSLYGYVKPRVQDEARRGNRDQTPQLQGGTTDDLILRSK